MTECSIVYSILSEKLFNLISILLIQKWGIYVNLKSGSQTRYRENRSYCSTVARVELIAVHHRVNESLRCSVTVHEILSATSLTWKLYLSLNKSNRHSHLWVGKWKLLVKTKWPLQLYHTISIPISTKTVPRVLAQNCRITNISQTSNSCNSGLK